MSDKFLYETHTHTKEASACAEWSAKESVRAHKEYGYTGIIITNHFYYGNTSVDRSKAWEDWVKCFCLPYYLAKEEGDRIGLQVFFGWESCYKGTEFLIYGLDEKWLLEHEEIRDASIEEQIGIVHSGGGIVIHPHPFREEDYIPEIRLYPEYIDGVEGYNASHCVKGNSHYDPEYDVRAREYAAKYDFPMTAGSDSHHLPMLGGGMIFNRKLTDIKDFTSAVMNRECVEFVDGSKRG